METIMPDGRPLYAWENQLAMQSSEIENIKKEREKFAILEALLGLVYEHWREPQTLDWHFRLKATNAITSYGFYQALLKHLEIVPSPKEK